MPDVPTIERANVLDLVHNTKDNILIESPAGGGKTTTLEVIQDIVEPPVLCLAFNKAVAERMRKGEEDEDGNLVKPPFKSTTRVQTLNSLGHGIWGSAIGAKLSLNPKKCQDLLREAIRDLNKRQQGDAYDEFFEITTAIGLAKSLGYVPEGAFPSARRLTTRTEFYSRLTEQLSDLGEELVDEVLTASIKAAYSGSIDYNDQIYMPALFGGTYPKFPLVLVDERQDLSAINDEMLWHMRASRIIAVGDPRQSIYAFRGALPGGMAKFKQRFNATEAKLTVSFRCPSEIVKAVHWHAPEMKWVREGGRAVRLRNPNATSFVDGSAIICRNNAPLFALAMRLLSSGRSVSVSGSDVGPRVIAIMRKLGPEDLKREALLNEIESWRAEKVAKQSTTANDIADCMRVFAGFGADLGQAISYAEHLFQQTGTLHLLTGHKAKGLEWPTVYHLDPFLIRNTDEQELNLRYVIQTRSMDSYYEIETKEIRW